jgi:hypothetical protein
MRDRKARDCRCSYVVAVDGSSASPQELRELAAYLSTLGIAGCDVVVLDPSARMTFELNGRILRWVGRHVPVRAEHCTPLGVFDPVRAAMSAALCDKVIFASQDVRYTPEAVGQLCDLLEMHEVVEPQDYLDPLPWWGSIEAGRILVHRGIEPEPDHGATFGFRRNAVRGLRSLGMSDGDDPARRLEAAGAEVFAAADVFVRREPGALDAWLDERPRVAGDDFAFPFKSAFFFSVVPLLMLLGALGGLQLAGIYTAVLSFCALGLALRGRIGATHFFPLHACLFAPLWVLERSVSVYWALFRKMRGVEAATRVALPDYAGKRVASGE